MKCSTRIIMHTVLTLTLFWLSAGIPEYMDWTIIPQEGKAAVWFGFHWIITSLIVMMIPFLHAAHIAIECKDERE